MIFGDGGGVLASSSLLCKLHEKNLKWRLNKIECEFRKQHSRVGRMNVYGSEGPKVSAKERECIKRTNKNGMILSSLNKTSIRSAMSYLTSTIADIVCVQELSQKWPLFYRTRAAMKKGTYMNRRDNKKDVPWRVEGTPSVDGPIKARLAARLSL